MTTARRSNSTTSAAARPRARPDPSLIPFCFDMSVVAPSLPVADNVSHLPGKHRLTKLISQVPVILNEVSGPSHELCRLGKIPPPKPRFLAKAARNDTFEMTSSQVHPPPTRERAKCQAPSAWCDEFSVGRTAARKPTTSPLLSGAKKNLVRPPKALHTVQEKQKPPGIDIRPQALITSQNRFQPQL